MEPFDNCPEAPSEHAPNGYAGLILSQDSTEIEAAGAMELSNLENSAAVDGHSKEETSWLKKKAKVNKIWNFVSRKKGPLGQGKRPQSMIVLSSPTRPSETKPKITFMDRMKSIKRLRSSSGLGKGATERSFKAQPSLNCPGDQEEGIWQKDLYRVRRPLDNQRLFRHSYAGHTEGLEDCFGDVEFNIPVPELEASDGKGSRDLDIQTNEEDQEGIGPLEVEDPQNDNENVASQVLRASQDCRKRCQTLPQENRRRRTSDVWSYLKGISLANRDNSKTTEAEPESNFRGMENAARNSTLFLGFESGHEESSRQMRRGSSTNKATHFGGVFRFFTNMAEAARKWRGSSRTPFPEEPKSSSKRHPLQLLEVPGENRVPASFLMRLSLQSPDIWDHSHIQTSTWRNDRLQNHNTESIHVTYSLELNSKSQSLGQVICSQPDISMLSLPTLQGEGQISPAPLAQPPPRGLSEAQPPSPGFPEQLETTGGCLGEKEHRGGRCSQLNEEAAGAEQSTSELTSKKRPTYIKEEEEKEDEEEGEEESGSIQVEEQDSFELLDETSHSKYSPKCHPFQMSLCTIVSLTEINSRKSWQVYSAGGQEGICEERGEAKLVASTALNSKTLESRRESQRKKKASKPRQPGAEQVFINKGLQGRDCAQRQPACLPAHQPEPLPACLPACLPVLWGHLPVPSCLLPSSPSACFCFHHDLGHSRGYRTSGEQGGGLKTSHSSGPGQGGLA